MTTELTRRDFLQRGSLVIGAALLQGDLLIANVSRLHAGNVSSFRPHAFIEI